MDRQLIKAARTVVDAAYRMGSNARIGNLMGEMSMLSSALAAEQAQSERDCGEAGHAEGRCGNAPCSARKPAAYLHEWKPTASATGKSLHWTPVSPHGDQVNVYALYADPLERKPLSPQRVLEVMNDAGWPESILAAPVTAKLKELVRTVERAHDIK